MKGRKAAAPAAAPRRAPRPHATPEPAPPRHPAVVVAILATAVSVLLSVSFAMFDPDLFQHLVVGRVIWETRGVSQEHLWTWAQWGTPQVLPSWLFRALLWPFWAAGEVWGLFAWRWLTTLAAFTLAWLTARRIGARGLLPLLVIAICALTYRTRTQVRPETFVAVLLALQLLILETRRQGGRDRSPWLVAIALLWANAHISYHLGILIQGLFWIDTWLTERAARPSSAARFAGTRRLGVILVASVAVSFLNPFGWRALWQPFEYLLYWRNEPIYLSIRELQPIEWRHNLVTGLPLIFAGWPLAWLWRASRGRLDRVEAAMMVLFTTLAWTGQRFLAPYALVAAAYASRTLSDSLADVRLGARIPLAARALLVAAAVLLVGLPTWSNPREPLGVRLTSRFYPVAACDFIEAENVRGRGFNSFEIAGYQLHRFWPERDRLPFMDIHQSGTQADRFSYAQMLFFEEGWHALDARHRFDYAMIARQQLVNNVGLNTLDADTAFALVFVDDVAALYVRREGPLAAIAERHAYHHVPAGDARIAALQRACATDSVACAEIEAELARALAASAETASLRGLSANIAAQRGDLVRARAELEHALRTNPNLLRGHERLGMIDLAENHPRAALARFREERRRNGALPGLELRMGQAAARLGNRAAAERHYRAELKRDPTFREAADSLATLGSR